MGLLDDAIREHLELKRRRGADPHEVARQEDEALGDPRNPEAAALEEPLEVPEFTAVEPEREPVPNDEPDFEEPPAAVAAGPENGPREPPAPLDEAWLDEADAGAGATAESTPPEPEVVAPDEEPPADEDVLEETPDFLQETPEHDRLWFEQKPPRGFDFDS